MYGKILTGRTHRALKSAAEMVAFSYPTFCAVVVGWSNTARIYILLSALFLTSMMVKFNFFFSF